MKKALKKIVALVATGAMAVSAFAMSASAAQCVREPWCSYHGEYDDCGYYYGEYVTLTAQQYKDGTVTASVNLPAGASVSYKWTGTNIDTNSTYATTKVTGSGGAAFTATCAVTFKYTVGPTGNTTTIERTISASVSGKAYSSAGDATAAGAPLVIGGDTGYGPDGYYYPSYVIPARNEYEVDWDTDTFYYDGTQQIPTATVTIGKRTIELDVKVISGGKDSTEVGSYRATASLPSGYRGLKLSGSSIRYTIEEALKQGLTTENGGVYYYTNGKAETGWKTVSGNSYYFGKDGKAVTGWQKLDGAWYYFDNSGVLQTGWVRTDGKTYYTNESGVMVASKWVKLDGYWYYFNGTGAMVESDWVKTGGKWYYLAADGKMATNTTIPGGYTVDASGAWVK